MICILDKHFSVSLILSEVNHFRAQNVVLC